MVDWRAIEVSLTLAAWTIVLLIPLATIAARWLAWTRMPGRHVVATVVALPLVLPPTVLGFYLLEIFSANSGIAGLYRSFTGGPLAFTFEGLVVAAMIFNLPFAVQPIQRAFEAIPVHVREAAWVSGLGGWQTFWRIEAPLAWPGFVTAFALVFAHSLGEFGVVLMVGGNIEGVTRTASVAIYDKVQSFETAAAGNMALLLLAISFAAIAVVNMTAVRQGGGR